MSKIKAGTYRFNDATIASKLEQIANNQQRIYQAGYTKGKAEGGGIVDIPIYTGEVEVRNNGKAS